MFQCHCCLPCGEMSLGPTPEIWRTWGMWLPKKRSCGHKLWSFLVVSLRTSFVRIVLQQNSVDSFLIFRKPGGLLPLSGFAGCVREWNKLCLGDALNAKWKSSISFSPWIVTTLRIVWFTLMILFILIRPTSIEVYCQVSRLSFTVWSIRVFRWRPLPIFFGLYFAAI